RAHSALWSEESPAATKLERHGTIAPGGRTPGGGAGGRAAAGGTRTRGDGESGPGEEPTWAIRRRVTECASTGTFPSRWTTASSCALTSTGRSVTASIPSS